MSVLVYGVLRAPAPAIAQPGVAGEAVTHVEAGELAALVSAAPDELLARRRDVTAHMNVLDEAMRHGPVLPFRFGTVAEGTAQVREMLDGRADELARQLDELDGTVQVTLRITVDEDAAVRAAVTRDRALRRLVESSQRRPGRLDQQVLLGERIAHAVAAQTEADRRRVLDRIAPRVVAMVPSEDAAAVVSVALLVQRSRLDELDAAISGVAAELHAAAAVDYAGPMPAYSFVR